MDASSMPRKKYKYRRKFGVRDVVMPRNLALEAMQEACRDVGVILTEQDRVAILTLSQGHTDETIPQT